MSIDQSVSHTSTIAAAALALAGLVACPSIARSETAAGAAIVNVGQLEYETAGQRATASSNASRIVVAERLDVTLAAGGIVAADGSIVVAATLTNRGNGTEAFAITANASAGDERLDRLAYDADGDGRYDPARDPVLGGGRTPALASGQSFTLFVVLSGGTGGTVTIAAAAVTGAGAPGTGFAGAGDNGGDAVTGPTGASASVTVALPGDGGATPTLAKSATVAATDGSSRAARGATITYTLVARFPAAAQGARVADPIPAGTAYLPASLTLDDAALSDAADADAGDATAARIGVALGDQPAGSVRTIRFKVVIQ